MTMPYINTVSLMGHLTANPELKNLAGGKTVCSFTIAINGRQEGEADFFPCEIWGGWAQNLAKTATKGSLVLVEGNLGQDRWEKDGQKHSRIKVKAQRAFHLEAKYADARDPGVEG